MTAQSSEKQTEVYIQDSENKSWLLFYCNQTSDGSIYLNPSGTEDKEWIVSNLNDTTLTPSNSHISFHGSGQSHLRKQGKKSPLLIVRGRFLKTSDKQTVSPRHLFTLFPSKPKKLLTEMPLPSDTVAIWRDKEPIMPFIILAFAVPKFAGLECTLTLPLDLQVKFPPICGAGRFNLQDHSLFMIMYRTKFMDKWPKHAHILFLDGVNVPIFLGKSTRDKTGMMSVEVREPKYSSEGNTITLVI